MKRWFYSMLAATIACSSSEAASPVGASSGSGPSASAGSSGSVASGGASDSGGGGGTSSGTGGGSGQGGNPSSDAGNDAEATRACASFAATLCAKIATCTPFVLGVLYGDAPTCERRVILSCVPSFGAAGTSAVPAKTTSCEQSIAPLACPTFLAGDWGAACKTDPGAVALGGPCGDDAQCVTTFCARAPDAACGICQPVTKAGDPCVRNSCSAGTVCPAGQSTCIAPAPGRVGDACTAQEQCDLAHAVGCNTTSMRCLALTLASPQGSCGANSILPTSYAVCPAGGTCSAPLGGNCSAAAADGANCSTADTGTHCLSPARCVAGQCVVPDPATCR